MLTGINFRGIVTFIYTKSSVSVEIYVFLLRINLAV